jgi:outer membrane autotransporter protein
MMSGRVFYFLSYFAIYTCPVTLAYATVTTLTEADFPRGKTFVSGSGNSIHVKNSESVSIIDALTVNTGVLSIENNAQFIADGHIEVINQSTLNTGNGLLVNSGAEAYFNGGLTAKVTFDNAYALAVKGANSLLTVQGATYVIADVNNGYGISLGAGTTATFDGDLNVLSGHYGINIDGGVSTFNHNVSIDINGDAGSGKRAINAKGQSVFNGAVAIDMHCDGCYGIYARSDATAFMDFNDLLLIKSTANNDFAGNNYGIIAFNNKINLKGGAIIDLSGDNFSHGRVGISVSQGTVNVQDRLAIYAPENSGTFSLIASNGGSIKVSDALVDINGDIAASGSGSRIDVQTTKGSIIRASTVIQNAGQINFDLTESHWYLTYSSHLNVLDATKSHFYFPEYSAGSFSRLTVESLDGRDNVFWLNTVLDDGSSRETSLLVINQNSMGQHKLHITNVGGAGNTTLGDGIKVVEVNGSSQADNFSLANVVRGGIYEYTLHQGSALSPTDQSWYLRSSARQLNPDIGSYLANQTAATGLFMHGLNDRLAEQQSIDGNRQPSVWLRMSASHVKNQAGGSVFDQRSDGYIIHLGGEIVNWTSDDSSRYHLGVMGAYGKSDTRTRSIATDSRVSGSVDGYSVGAYLTWYENDSQPEGWYTDIWSMYSWFDNQTESTAKYKSRAWTGSAEVGYAVKALESGRWQWMAEPHVQAAYTDYRADEHTDSKGMRVSDDDASGIYTRVGARFYLRDGQNEMNAQPFIEANWLHNTAKNSLKFNGQKISDDTPKNRFEGKIGVQGAVTKNVQVYSHIGLQWGQDKYERTEGQVGVKYRF